MFLKKLINIYNKNKNNKKKKINKKNKIKNKK